VIRSVGVIVPAHDEQDLLPSCLASVRRAAQALRGMPVYVVVVADACRDRTVQAARRGGASVVSISARSAGAARAAGAREVLRRTSHLDPTNVWLATTDADTLVPAHWLRQQVRHASQGWDAISAYLSAGGFPLLPTAEDHALVAALTVGGSRVLRTRALPVITSARRHSRAPDGFRDYLVRLEATPA
jgi:glycosyltransferase involved in cell wall biosynthesis